MVREVKKIYRYQEGIELCEEVMGIVLRIWDMGFYFLGLQGLLGVKLNCRLVVYSVGFYRDQELYIYSVQFEVFLVSAWFQVWDVDDVFLFVVGFLELKKGNWLMSIYDCRN